MADYKCENCGAFCAEDKNYCSKCGNPIRKVTEDQVIKGISNSELHSFIDKNASRYVEAFAKNKDKKIFLGFNWAAGLFGFSWMFYRRMYKYAFVFLAINLALTVILCCGFVTANRDDIKDYIRVRRESGYSALRGEEVITADEDGNLTVGLVPQEITQIEAKAQMFLSRSATALLVLNIALALFADCIYRRFIKENISLSRGGVSVGSFFVGAVAEGFITSAVETVMALVLAVILG